jgi:hypothetical protein
MPPARSKTMRASWQVLSTTRVGVTTPREVTRDDCNRLVNQLMSACKGSATVFTPTPTFLYLGGNWEGHAARKIYAKHKAAPPRNKKVKFTIIVDYRRNTQHTHEIRMHIHTLGNYTTSTYVGQTHPPCHPYIKVSIRVSNHPTICHPCKRWSIFEWQT